MIAVYIILALVLLLLLILISPLRIKIHFEEKLYITVRFWFFKYTFNTDEEDDYKEDITEIKSDKKNKKQVDKGILNQNGLPGFIDLLGEMLKLANDTFSGLFARFIIDNIELNIQVCGDDAANTAIKYGAVCSTVYPIVSVFARREKTRNYNLNISPNYIAKKTTIYFDFIGHAKIIDILSTSLLPFIRFIKFITATKTKNRN